ncbi:MAG: DUF3846 domain-containing protein [Deltaproteobacteria bacterium]|nr:DUF3846 domain-containing protein [Deltaproteobacteria bacterium]
MSEVIFLGTDDSIKISERDTPPPLKELQEQVDGNIELVHVLFRGEPAQLIVNEEGLMYHLPFNAMATGIYQRYWFEQHNTLHGNPIVGNAVLLTGGAQLD